MGNIKISDLNKTNNISDDALMLIVQDDVNETITIKDLTRKINQDYSRLLNKFHQDIKNMYSGIDVTTVKELISKQTYNLLKMQRYIQGLNARISGLERKNEHIFDEIRKLNFIVEKHEKDNAIIKKTLKDIKK